MHHRGNVHRGRHAESFDLLPIGTTIAETWDRGGADHTKQASRQGVGGEKSSHPEMNWMRIFSSFSEVWKEMSN